MNFEFPKKLYKYRSGSDIDISTLRKKKIFVPDFFNLNDLFESDFEFDLIHAKDKANMFFPQIIRNEFHEPIFIPFMLSRELKEEELQWNVENIEERIKSKRNEVFKKGVYSLSRSNDNLLMWGHYSDSHNGYCIEYAISKDFQLDKSFIGPYPVDYQESPPKLPWFLIDYYPEASIRYHMLGIKSKVWEYENEFRLIYPEGLREFDFPFKIESIIFGARASDKLKADIQAIFNDSISYKKCVKGQDGYTLCITDLDS